MTIPDQVRRWTAQINGHLVWIGALNKGRPIVSVGGKKKIVRRWLYSISTNEQLTPATAVVANCTQRLCVNPEHLITKPANSGSRRRSKVRIPVFDVPWLDQAACKDTDVAVFFQSNQTDAKAICAACPVRQECADYARQHRFPIGIFGGLKAAERNA